MRLPKMTSCARWSATIVAVLTLTIWMLSLRFQPEGRWFTPDYGYSLSLWMEPGRLAAYVAEYASADPHLYEGEFDPSEIPTGNAEVQSHFVEIPIWIPFLLSTLLASYLWSRRETTAGRCFTCNYDRCGLDPAAACPECGEKRS